jgi:t-SNARE complex subunit (syntaxin)
MVFMQWRITSLWIIVALLLFAVLVVVAVAFYSPLLRNLIKLVDAGDTTSPDFARLARQNRMLGPGIGLIVVLILVMMVFKPTL